MTSRSTVSLVTRRATARVCSTTTAWLTVVSPLASRSSRPRSWETLRPTSTASAKSSTASSSGHRGRRGALSVTAAHRGFDLADLAGRAAQPLDPGGRDDIVVLDPHADILVALDRGPHAGDHRPVLRRVGQDVEQP